MKDGLLLREQETRSTLSKAMQKIITHDAGKQQGPLLTGTDVPSNKEGDRKPLFTTLWLALAVQ